MFVAGSGLRTGCIGRFFPPFFFNAYVRISDLFAVGN